MKLTDAQVGELRHAAIHGGTRLAALAARYGISQTLTSNIVHGKARRKAPGPTLGKGERHRGENPPKFTDHQIVTIRLKLHHGALRDTVAREYGTYPEYITAVARGRIAPHLPGPRTSPRAGLTEDDVMNIREEYANDRTPFKALAERYDVSADTVRFAVRGRTWKTTSGPITKQGA